MTTLVNQGTYDGGDADLENTSGDATLTVAVHGAPYTVDVWQVQAPGVVQEGNPFDGGGIGPEQVGSFILWCVIGATDMLEDTFQFRYQLRHATGNSLVGIRVNAGGETPGVVTAEVNDSGFVDTDAESILLGDAISDLSPARLVFIALIVNPGIGTTRKIELYAEGNLGAAGPSEVVSDAAGGQINIDAGVVEVVTDETAAIRACGFYQTMDGALGVSHAQSLFNQALGFE